MLRAAQANVSTMKEMKKILTLVLMLVPLVLSAAEYPSLLKIPVGERFSHPQGMQNKDKGRPTTQFRVPNHGNISSIFSEYSIAYLNATGHVVIVTAEKAVKNWEECESLKEKASLLISQAFPNYKSSPVSNSQLGAPGEFSLESADTYYVLRCQGSYGPFAYLHFQIRSKSQDIELKNAWDE